MDYKFIADLNSAAKLPDKGILSNVLHKDENVNVTLFGFSAGEELSAHSAPTPAILHSLEGDADVQLGDDVMHAKAGSFVFHATNAVTRHPRKHTHQDAARAVEIGLPQHVGIDRTLPSQGSFLTPPSQA
jgi:quercetin dioxygenase-like cupin family protein